MFSEALGVAAKQQLKSIFQIVSIVIMYDEQHQTPFPTISKIALS